MTTIPKIPKNNIVFHNNDKTIHSNNIVCLNKNKQFPKTILYTVDNTNNTLNNNTTMF